MQPVVQFVGFDSRGLISKERWQVTKAHCPRCGQGDNAVWTLTSEPPVILPISGQQLGLFLCISCNFTALGLNGIVPSFKPQDRSKQIIKLGFEEAE